jgi:non-specific serine/threonine protein kinase
MPEPRLSSALADRYRLEREIGAGGMATVYLAEDLKHHRKVAIKVLRPELSAAVGAERFHREITTTANLRHPNILPLFDSGESAGFLFYVMPFVQGESLRARMDREAQLPVADVLRIADEIADALEYAHGRGVIHRDVKPENVLLEDGRAVVADFGIAQAVNAGGADKLTMTGMSLGTPHYMSPEQAGGEEVDGRSDLYALGCMVYEMLAGVPPFTGSNAMAIVARHLMDPVPNLTTVRPSVAPHVTEAIVRALAKVPADRFSGVADWRKAMRPPQAAPASGQAAGPPAILMPPPVPATPLLGRDDALADAEARLTEGARVLTVTGVGGTGKTRLAIELFRRRHADFPGGAAFVSLASVTSPAEVMTTVATTLEIAEAHGRSALDAIVTVVGDRSVLLVLDNMEQVVEAASDVAVLVSRCPGLRLITTSRRPLKIGAEAELALPPLDLPDEGTAATETLLACPSVALFVQRAEKVKPGFALTPANASAIVGVCRSLDGLPLALELAAARVRILEPAALLQRLDHALDLLTSGDRDLPMRQRTLRATISWSYSLLDEPEQRLLRRLSVFHEGWTLAGVEHVCFDEADRWRAVDALESLVEKGLVRVVGEGGRYALLETIRAFAAEQLHAGGETEPARDAHAAYFLDFARGIDAGINCRDDGQLEAMRRGHLENANTLAALHWLLARARSGVPDAVEQGLLMCGYLGWYWHICGLHMVARSTVDALLELAAGSPPSVGRAKAGFTAGIVSASTGEMERAVTEWTRQLDDARAVGDLPAECLGLICIGYVNLGMGRLDEAKAPFEAGIERAREGGLDYLEGLGRAMNGMRMFAGGDAEGGKAMMESARRIQIRIGDFEGSQMALGFQASMAFAEGDLRRALDLYREAEATAETVGDKPEVARIQCETGYAALAGSELGEARRMFLRALRTYDEVGSPRGAGQALLGLAAVEGGAGDTERAVVIAAAAQVMSERAGVVIEHALAPGVSERIEALRASVPKARLDALVASGSALSPAEVLAMVATSTP